MGALIGLGVAVWDSPPAYIENWLRGAEGERRTERALSPLRRSGWTFAHDIETEGGNRDHVACGPGGVFLLETRRPGGEVTVQGDVVRVQRLDDPDLSYDMSRLGGRLRREATKLSAELQADTGGEHGFKASWSCGRRFPSGSSRATASSMCTATSWPGGSHRVTGTGEWEGG